MAIKPDVSQKLFAETRQQWPLMSLYERFEQVVASVLSLVVAVVVALALAQLLIRVVPLLVSGAIDPLDHEVFQSVFGVVMTLLIAMEFKHSISLAFRIKPVHSVQSEPKLLLDRSSLCDSCRPR